MTTTTHFNLKKPEGSDYADVTVLNENAEIIDAALHTLDQGKASLGQDGKVPAEQLPDMELEKHASQHATNGDDPITPESIGAAQSTHEHSASDIKSGIVAVSRGGTGKGSWAANRLIYPSAGTAFSQLAFPAVAGSVLRQGTSGAPYWTSLADLTTAMGASKIESGTYTGTGTAADVSLTFTRTPKVLFICRKTIEDKTTNESVRFFFVSLFGSNYALVFTDNEFNSTVTPVDIINVTWEDNKVTWSPGSVGSYLNKQCEYQYYAIS